jgi:hypothetical protein
VATDQNELIQLNSDFGHAEASGDHEWLGQHIAPPLAFLRADGKTIDDRATFLSKVSPCSPGETQIISIDIHGDRAMVACLVTVQSQTEAKTYHNLRLFVRHEGTWKLLGWANEPV